MTETPTVQESFMDVITGLTPLECGLLNEHPRLHLMPPRVAHLREHIAERPYAAMFERVRRHADQALSRGCPDAEAAVRQDIRGIGEDIGFISLTYLLTMYTIEQREPAVDSDSGRRLNRIELSG